MKQVKFVSGLLLSLLLVASCSKIEDIDTINIAQDGGDLLVIEASAESYDSQTKTIRQEDGSVYWNPNDEISLFFIDGEDGGYKFTSQNKETAVVAEFAGTINGITGGGENLTDEAYFWAIYPYSASNSCNGSSISTSLSQKQQAVQDTFADDLFITIARSTGVKMAFKNVCGGMKFRVSQSGIKSIVFRGNNEEVLAGDFRATFDESNQPTISEIINGKTQITVIAPNGGTFDVGKYYYLVSLPAVLKNGFTITFHKADGTSGTYTRTSKVEIKRSIFGVVRDLDQGLTFSTDNTIVDNSESGFYIGIIGFNQGLRTYPISHLSEQSTEGFYSFINGLTTNKGTLLYYAVDKSIDALQGVSFPSNLSDVAVVTFTDGLDSGSLDASDYYLTNDEYSTALKTRLSNELVSEQKISAYSIGVQGDDVGYNTTLFQQNLNNLATSSDNVFKVTNMSEVNTTFMKIADLLGETKYVQNFLLEISSPSNGVRCRFTFDNVAQAANSKQYIEATFIRPEENRALRTLCDLTFVGLTSSTIAPVIGVKNESNNKYAYLFEGLQAPSGALIPTDKVQYWYQEGSVWQKDSEFYFDPGTAGIEKIKRSAAILLNLDCSSSLGDDFTSLQGTAKSFIDKLLTNSIDPGEVASIKLNKSAITLTSGSTTTLKATVLPTTALKKDVEWSSTNSAVASVDQTGKITAISPGSTTIIAKTVDGGLTATCSVSVVMLANKVQLDYSELELYNGDTHTLQATVFPENASDKTVSWSSSNTAVATVDSNGIITPVKAGQTTITAIAKDGSGVKATCLVTVLQHVESISLSEASTTIYVGEKKQIKATVYPSDATNKNVVWTSSNDTIVSVDQIGLITAKASGSATISVAAQDGSEVISKCSIIVKQPEPVTSIGLDSSSVSLALGSNKSLTVSLLPSNAYNKEFSVASSNTAVATVSKSGGSIITIKSVGVGTATITVTSNDGGYTAKCNVTVTLSKTASNLALAVKKNDVRYFIPLSVYSSVNLSGYTKEGIAIVYGSTSFILALNDASSSTLTFADANKLGTLPTQSQATAIVQYWSSINSALSTYGGTTFKDSYWTSAKNDSTTAYRYYSGGVSSVSASRTYYARKVIAIL